MMKDGEMLDYVHEATEMGRYGILTVLGEARRPELRSALEQQLTEYEKLMDASATMLGERGKHPKALGAMAKLSSRISARMQTMMDPSQEKIAEMMVQGNTMGMTKSLRHLHDFRDGDPRVRDLADKLLQTEEANIEQMKTFL